MTPAVMRVPPGTDLQGGRQLQEGLMPFAQSIPLQPLRQPLVAVDPALEALIPF
jgi:hypothetical protein